MNKRQKKKRSKKCLPILADEANLLTMTDEEFKEAIREAELYRQKYGYRKKYKNLKGCLRYHYPAGSKWKDDFSKINAFFNRGREIEPVIVIQDIDKIRASYDNLQEDEPNKFIVLEIPETGIDEDFAQKVSDTWNEFHK